MLFRLFLLLDSTQLRCLYPLKIAQVGYRNYTLQLYSLARSHPQRLTNYRDPQDFLKRSHTLVHPLSDGPEEIVRKVSLKGPLR